MKNVLIIDACDFKEYPMGGQLFLLKNLLKNRNQNHLNIKLIGLTNDSHEESGKWYTRKIGENTYDFFPLFKVCKIKEKTIIPFRLRMVLGLSKYLKQLLEQDFNIIYIHSSELLIPIKKYRFKNNLKIIFHVHGEPDTTLKISRFKLFRLSVFSNIYNKLIDGALNTSDLVIWASNRARKRYSIGKHGVNANKYVTVHSSIDDDLLEANFNNFSELEHSRYLLYVGRLAKVKGIEFIIESFSKISNRFEDLKLVLCGDGEEKSNIKEYINTLKLNDRIIIVDNARRNELCYYYKNALAFVFASYSEAMSLVILEALSFGLPIISTDVGDINEVVIDDFTGMLVKKHDIEEFTDAIIRVTNNGKEFYYNNCINVSLNYKSSIMSEKIYSFMDKL